ncbi:MAG: fimbrial protein, partial [Hafnia sp.]
MRAKTGAISTLFLLMISTSAIANCTKIIAQSQLSSASDGVASSWPGSLDNNNGSLGLPSVVDISTSNDFQPDGTLLASSVAPFTSYAINSGYESERVLFRCDAADASQI